MLTKSARTGEDRHEEGIWTAGRYHDRGGGESAAEIQEALGELVGAARDGLLAVSVGVGLRVVHGLMEAEVTEIVGPKGKHDPERTASRHGHGHEEGSMMPSHPIAIRQPKVSRVAPTAKAAPSEPSVTIMAIGIATIARIAQPGAPALRAALRACYEAGPTGYGLDRARLTPSRGSVE